MFESTEEVRQSLEERKYLCDRKLATVVFLATRLDKPILAEGPAGVGKTELLANVRGTNQRTALDQRNSEQHEVGREIWSMHHHKTKPAPGDRYGSL